MDIDLMEEALVSGCDRLREGQIVKHEGKEAEVISVKPFLIIKIEDRVICGALHKRIDLIED